MSVLSHEPLIRLACFAAVFAVLALWESRAPRRVQEIGRASRWPGNLGVVIVDTLVLRLLFPTAAVGAALLGEARGWGLLNPRPARLAEDRDRGRRPRPRDLSPARALPRGAAVVAAASPACITPIWNST